MQPIIYIDLETQSAANLRSVGATRYLRDPSTRLMSLAALVNSRMLLWVPDGRSPDLGGLAYRDLWPKDFDPLPLDFYTGPDCPPELAAGGTFLAHNAYGFDAPAWKALELPGEPTWIDTVPLCRAAGLSARLGALGERFLGVGKDESGHDVMKILTRARVSKTGKVVYPVGTVSAWRDLLRYNIVDVLLLAKIHGETGLSPEETRVLAEDQRINQRGIPIDVPLARHVLELWHQWQKRATDELAELTDGAITEDNVRSTKQVTAWFASKGVRLNSLERKQLEAFFADPDEDGDWGEWLVDRDESTVALMVSALQLRQQSVRATKGKVERAIASVDADSRVRGVLVYHGAHTGRWTGRALQPHNMPKGVMSKRFKIGELLTDYHAGRLTLERVIEYARQASTEKEPITPDAVLTSLFRPIVCAPAGKLFCIADWAGIEMRGQAWFADETPLLSALRDGTDPYREMAAKIFDIPIGEVTDYQRYVGKETVLGCIAEGSPVLTDSGWKPIETVLMTDRLWDGLQWVAHDGVITKGLKHCVNVAGVYLTPDHEVLTAKGWVEAWSLEGSTPPPLSGRYMKTGQLRIFPAGRGVESSLSAANALAGRLRKSFPTISARVRAWAATSVRNGNQGKREPANLAILKSFRTRHTGSGCLLASLLSSDGLQTRLTRGILTTGAEEFAYTPLGLKIESYSSRTLSRYRDGIGRSWKSTGPTTTRGMSLETSDSLPAAFRTVIGGVTSGERRTYDIANAGPLHRFQVGPLLVHNCGYGMGANKFEGTCKLRSPPVDLEKAGTSAEACIRIYRETYKNIVAGWKWLQLSALSSFQHPKRGYWQSKLARMKPLRSCRFELRGDALALVLPSGRAMMFRNARIETYPPGEEYVRACIAGGMPEAKARRPVPQVTFQHPRGYAARLYGGCLMENLVQATSRDILAYTLVRGADEGLDFCFHVHDEPIAEADEERAAETLKRLCEIMSEGPKWAEGFPIKVEGFCGKHYTKSPVAGFPRCTATRGIANVE